MRMFVFDREADKASPITEQKADARYRHSDAGVDLSRFIVIAPDATKALDAGRRWCACWEDDDQASVPDDLMLVEREWKPGKTYMVLETLA